MSEPSPFSLAGKLAVVSGGTRGIGLAIARGLGRAGAEVVLIGRDRAKAEESKASLMGEGLTVSFLLADVSREEDCRTVAEALAQRARPLNILVNNAGTNDRRPPENYSMEDWHFLIDANLTSVFALTRALKPLMTHGGKIINIGSMTSIFGASFSAPYGAAKGGVVQLSKALASAWAREHPGQCDPPRLDRDRTHPSRPYCNARSPGEGYCPHTRWPLGSARRHRRCRRFPRQPRFRLHHGSCAACRWRLLGSGMKGSSTEQGSETGGCGL